MVFCCFLCNFHFGLKRQIQNGKLCTVGLQFFLCLLHLSKSDKKKHTHTDNIYFKNRLYTLINQTYDLVFTSATE